MTNSNTAFLSCLRVAEGMERLHTLFHRWYRHCGVSEDDLDTFDEHVFECNALVIEFG